MSNHSVTFYVELASPYSYLAAARIDALAAQKGVDVVWTPFLLGAIFQDHGYSTSPFLVHHWKLAYLWRDAERLSEAYGLPFRSPTEAELPLFPQNTLHPARLTLVGLEAGWGKAFAFAVFRALYDEWRDISSAEALRDLVHQAGGDPMVAFEQAQTPEIKLKLRANTEAAKARGVFGAPTMVVGDELFWGHDRIEMALDWALRGSDTT